MILLISQGTKGEAGGSQSIQGELRKQPRLEEDGEGKARAELVACPPTCLASWTQSGKDTLGMRRALRLDSSSLVVLRLSSLRLEGEDGRLS